MFKIFNSYIELNWKGDGMAAYADMIQPEGHAQGYSYIEDGKLKTKPNAPEWAVKEAEKFNRMLSNAKKQGMKVWLYG